MIIFFFNNIFFPHGTWSGDTWSGLKESKQICLTSIYCSICSQDLETHYC